jgi:hypothetical protein
MKKCFQLTFLCSMLFVLIPDANSFVLDVKPKIEKSGSDDFSDELSKTNLSKKQIRKLKRKNRKVKRLEKKIAMFQHKWEMRGMKKRIIRNNKQRRFFGGVTDDSRFRIGVLLIIASLVIGVLARVPLFGGLFGLLSGLCGLVGIVLIIIAFVAFYQ